MFLRNNHFLLPNGTKVILTTCFVRPIRLRIMNAVIPDARQQLWDRLSII